MRKKFKKLVGITTAVAMAVSLVPTNVFAEEPEVAVAEESAKNDNLLRVWYDEPATDWQTQSLAIGNGYMGGLVFGGINNDKIHINEKTVWEGGPADSYDYTYGTTNPIDTDADLQKIKDNLNALREKFDDKSEFVFGFDEDSYQASGTDTKGEAMDELNKLMGDLTGYDAPTDYANLFISNNQDEKKVSNYVRDLDMRTALATVNYDYEGVHYTREYFNSYPDNIMAVRLRRHRRNRQRSLPESWQGYRHRRCTCRSRPAPASSPRPFRRCRWCAAADVRGSRRSKCPSTARSSCRKRGGRRRCRF